MLAPDAPRSRACRWAGRHRGVLRVEFSEHFARGGLSDQDPAYTIKGRGIGVQLPAFLRLYAAASYACSSGDAITALRF